MNLPTFVFGSADCYAGIFVLKADATVEAMKTAITDMQTASSECRGEIHAKADSFRDELWAWLEGIPSGEAFLCIYAHAGAAGIASKAKPAADEMLTWNAVTSLLGDKVARLWLVGCKTDEVLKELKGSNAMPATTMLVVTEDSASFAKLAQFFHFQFDLGKLVINCELADLLERMHPEIAIATRFYWLKDGQYEPICRSGERRP